VDIRDVAVMKNNDPNVPKIKSQKRKKGADPVDNATVRIRKWEAQLQLGPCWKKELATVGLWVSFGCLVIRKLYSLW